GQAFVAWRTGFGPTPATCGSSAGQPADPADVIVPADGTFQIWAQGYVGDNHCFTVSTSTVVDTGHPTPTTSAPVTTTSPVTSAPGTTAPVTTTPAAPTTTPIRFGPPAVATSDVTPPSIQLTARQI